ncbi:uncharacterized protein LOC126560690 [Anopheles maculipalpis]|uniref:uncharacterized protein LOC126560690 n=1 Tax=Anopheles maculipalpis TaxID=1496333 RepID=UPI0021599586|nr:uncharacterized protein LOC126560690 [Anopheles maculipalpis]
MLQDTFAKIKPFVNRQKRWDTLGKIWKWIAGTPDADDLHVINSTMNSLIAESNKQIIINQGFNDRLKQITDVANQVVNIENECYESHQVEIRKLILLSNINMLQEKLDVIEDAILLVKHGIPSSKLLSLEDLTSIEQFLEKNSIKYNTPEELLRQSTAQVAVNESHTQIASNCSKMNQVLNGSYVIQFENCNIIINGEIYSNNEVTIPGKPFKSTAEINIDKSEIEHKPPLQLIQKLTIEHREKLQSINLQNDSLRWKFNVFGGTFAFICLCALIICLFFHFKRTTIKTNFIPRSNEP